MVVKESEHLESTNEHLPALHFVVRSEKSKEKVLPGMSRKVVCVLPSVQLLLL